MFTSNPATFCFGPRFAVVHLRSMKLSRPYRKWQKSTPNRAVLVIFAVLVDVFGIVVIVGGHSLARAKCCGTVTRNNNTITTKFVHFGCCLQRAFKVVFKVDKSGVTVFS